MGLGQTEHFQRYHRVLNRAAWSGRAASHVLLGVLVKTFMPSGPLVIGVDETLERRWGKKIADRKSTRLNSSHANISYAVFCLKKKKKANYKNSYQTIKYVNMIYC